MSEVWGKLLGAISLGDAWDIYRIRLPGQPVLALILSPRIVPSMFAYRPDYLCYTVIGVWRPNRPHLSKDLRDELLIMVLGNDSRIELVG